MAYNMLKNMAEEGKVNWASAVRDLLCVEWISGRLNTFLD